MVKHYPRYKYEVHISKTAKLMSGIRFFVVDRLFYDLLTHQFVLLMPMERSGGGRCEILGVPTLQILALKLQ